MFQFLPNEEVIADLRRGAIQRLTSDLLLLRTIILTNQRLILIEKKLGSFSKKFIFLRDVQGLASGQHISIPAIILATLFGLGFFATMAAIGQDPGATVVSITLAGAAVASALNISKNAIVISTMTQEIEFVLEFTARTPMLEEFLNTSQELIAQQKKVV